MKYFDPQDIETSALYRILSDAVTPRPIAFVSTVDAKGNKNLSPFSFFGIFSINPPILVFSPTRRVRDNTTKDTLENVLETKEAVICMVNQKIVHQMSLSSTEYSAVINEFVKSGLTEVKATKVKPSLVKESPLNFECKVIDVISMGNEGGAGNLIICEVVAIHANENIFDQNNKIDALKYDVISRYGGNWYGKTTKEGLFEIEKPISSRGIGIDQLPQEIRKSKVLTGYHLAQLATIEKLPDNGSYNPSESIHVRAKELIEEGKTEEAWTLLNS
ncbi:MAG: flavin reductase family protein [Bacteroidetes bacterium]|nr:flavin reductase family protein [Bacteroidota bacterium]